MLENNNVNKRISRNIRSTYYHIQIKQHVYRYFESGENGCFSEILQIP